MPNHISITVVIVIHLYPIDICIYPLSLHDQRCKAIKQTPGESMIAPKGDDVAVTGALEDPG